MKKVKKSAKVQKNYIMAIFLVLNVLLLFVNFIWGYCNNQSRIIFNKYKEISLAEIKQNKNSIPECVKQDYLSEDPKEYSVLNTEKERKLLNKYLKKSDIYFEYGSGGSTFEALKRGVDKVYSVENSQDWLVNFMYRFDFIKQNEDEGNLEIVYIDTDETEEWGYPRNKRKDYRVYPEAFAKREKYKEADLVLIDGRYRVASLMQVLLNAKNNPIIMIHDSWRNEYKEAYQFLDEIERADALTVFSIKKDINLEDVKKMYERYRWDMR